MAFAQKSDIGVIDCLSGKFAQAVKSPFIIGSGSSCDLQVDDDSVLDQHCLIEKTKKGIQIRAVQAEHPSGGLVLDGKPTNAAPIPARSERSLQIGKSFLMVTSAQSVTKVALQQWGVDIRRGGWIINKSNPEIASQPLELEGVFAARDSMGLDPATTPVFKGGSQMGFYLKQLMALEHNGAEPAPQPTHFEDEDEDTPVASRVKESSPQRPRATPKW